jgi:hypothetical protein
MLERATTFTDEQVVDADAALLTAVPELLAIRDDSVTIREWLVSLIPFFTRARELEVAAKKTLEDSKLLTLPANADDDTRLKAFITRASADNKVVAEHWKVTSLVHQFQRRLVAVRDRSCDALEEAAKRAQQLHNQYVKAENDRVAEENRRRQKEADDKAAAERQAELDRLEAERLKLEAASADLSDRERIFVDQVASGTPAMYAARNAGYKDYTKQGDLLMGRLKIALAIKAKQDSENIRKQAEAKKAEPLKPAEIIAEKAQLGAGGVDRTTKSAEIFDARLFVEAVIGGRHAIPADCLMPDPVKLNQYARSLGDIIDRWPGVRLKKGTTTV